MALYPKIESIGSTGSIVLAILEVQVDSKFPSGSLLVFCPTLNYDAAKSVTSFLASESGRANIKAFWVGA